MFMTTEPPTLAAAIGANARRLRKERSLTLEQVARRMQLMGFRWSASRVTEMESGRVAPNLATLMALGTALAGESNAVVSPLELLPTSGPVLVGKGVTIDIARLRNWVSGSTDSSSASLIPDQVQQRLNSASEQVSDVLNTAIMQSFRGTLGELANAEDVGLSSKRAAKTLGVTVSELAVVAFQLWGRGFVAERDRRAQLIGNENAQVKGRVTRELLSEASARISELRGQVDRG